MMLTKEQEELWYWYEHTLECRRIGMKIKEYSKFKSLEYDKFCNMSYRIEYIKNRNPEEYKKIMALVHDFRISNQTAREYCIKNNVNMNQLKVAITHNNCMNQIEEIKKIMSSQPKNEEKKSDLVFFQVNKPNEIPLINQQNKEPEFIEKKNDIELSICKGVKVIASPELSSDKLIKIIELLKDL